MSNNAENGDGAYSEDPILESLPEYVISTMEVRDRWFTRSAPPHDGGKAFVVEDLLRWQPGQTVRVAFRGGETQLHRDIEEATREITDACNIKLDFGFNEQTGTFRRWSTDDQEYAAEIRVSFDQPGYFSLLGTDSVNPNIGAPGQPVGGRPNQRTLNLGGFHVQRPQTWRGTTRHEFLHALAFHHEHQHPGGGCTDEFRWQDDPGYQPTRDANGVYINDEAGRRPGIYTFLAGAPNFWSRAKVDHNLRRLSPTGVTTGNFDRASIMLYRFPALFYRSSPSPCAPSGNGQSLSQGDRDGLRHLYPSDQAEAEVLRSRSLGAVELLLGAESISLDLKEGLRAQFKALSEK